MVPTRIEGFLQRAIRHAAAGHAFLLACMGLSLAGTLSAAYPVTAVVVPAALLLPRLWRQISVFSALGSAVGATLLVLAFHNLGWEQIYDRFPQLATHATWLRVMGWAAEYGAVALFLVAVSPLPQTPALIFFGIARHDPAIVFFAMLAGKLIKYALFAWLTIRFPERFGEGVGGILFRRRRKGGTG